MHEPQIQTTAPASNCPVPDTWALPGGLMELSREQPELVAELIDMFLSDSEERLQDIRERAGAHDRPAVSRQAHSIKGAAQQMGAHDLAATCRTLELEAGSLAEAAFTALLDRLHRDFDRVAGAMRPCRDRLRAGRLPEPPRALPA